MQYTLNGETGDRSSDGDEDTHDADGLSSNPLAHPFSNTLYNYGQHTSLPQPWQQASGLAISYPNHGMNGEAGGNKTGGMYPDDDVLEREMALLEEEDPTLFLDGLMDPRTEEELDTLMPLETTARASASTSNSRPQTAQSTKIAPPMAQPQPKAGPSRPPMTSSASQTHHHHGYQPASLSSITGAKDRSLDQLLISFWTHQMDLAEKGTAANGGAGDAGEGQHEEQDEFKTFGLPLARIKKVMKSDPDVKMISAEVPVLLSKACEIFIAELTCRAWLVAESHKRRTLQKSDVASAIGFSDMFDFLIDIVPREEAISKSELGMKRRTARMKEKKEEERKRKRQEELEEAYAFSQAQARAQSQMAAQQQANQQKLAANGAASGGQGSVQRAEGSVRPSEGPGQLNRTQSYHREGDMPPEKKRKEE